MIDFSLSVIFGQTLTEIPWFTSIANLGIGGLFFIMWWKERKDKVAIEEAASRERSELEKKREEAISRERELAVNLSQMIQIVQDNTTAMNAMNATMQEIRYLLEANYPSPSDSTIQRVVDIDIERGKQ